MSETVPVTEDGGVETNKTAYKHLDSLVSTRLGQLPSEVLDNLQGITFSLRHEDLPKNRGRNRVDSVTVQPTEEGWMRIVIINPLYSCSSVFDLSSEGDLHTRGQDVWDEVKQEMVPRALTPAHLPPEELVSNLDTYLPVLETLPATVEIEIPAVSVAVPQST